MGERIETDWERRFLAGLEAIELLDRAGFLIHDFSVEEEAGDSSFGIQANLSVGETTYPLDSLEDEPNEDFGEGFILGLQAGLMCEQSS